MSEDQARAMSAAHNETMSGCILDLYRSAVSNVFADRGAEAVRHTPAPGLVLLLPASLERRQQEQIQVWSAAAERLAHLPLMGAYVHLDTGSELTDYGIPVFNPTK